MALVLRVLFLLDCDSASKSGALKSNIIQFIAIQCT